VTDAAVRDARTTARDARTVTASDDLANAVAGLAASVIGSSWAQSLALCVTSCATMICASVSTANWAL
jgi:hypothetical protein